MAFSEVREYQFGDDIRAIDWNVSARFNHPFVKVFEEERELTVMLVVDVSRSAEHAIDETRDVLTMTRVDRFEGCAITGGSTADQLIANDGLLAHGGSETLERDDGTHLRIGCIPPVNHSRNSLEQA